MLQIYKIYKLNRKLINELNIVKYIENYSVIIVSYVRIHKIYVQDP